MKTLVEQIHNEFYSAQDRIILQCPNSSAETLYNLGFFKSKSAADYDPFYYETRRYAEGYKQKYPQYKFISEKQVAKICSKYSLFLTHVGNYTGSVPHSKVAEIASFKIDVDDLRRRTFREWGEGERMHVTVYEHSSFHDLMDLWICAPESDIDDIGLTKTGHNIVDIRVEDPVVLQTVEGGFLIVAAWGPEASDEDVVNEKMN